MIDIIYTLFVKLYINEKLFMWLVIIFLGAIFLIVYVFQEENIIPRMRKFLYLFLIASFFAFILSRPLLILKTDTYAWLLAQKKGDIKSYMTLVRNFPKSTYMADAKREIARLQYLDIIKEKHKNRLLLKKNLQAQDAIPNKFNIVVNGHRHYHHNSGKGDIFAYDRALDGFEKQILHLAKELVAPFDPDIVQDIKRTPPFDKVTMVIEYHSNWGDMYNVSYYGYSGVYDYTQDRSFQAILLSASWAVYLPGASIPRLVGETGVLSPPYHPEWKGSKYPEDVVADIVKENAISRLKNDFGLNKKK